MLLWHEYWCMEPFGEWRGDARSAQICAVIANVNRDPKAKPEPFGIDDFMLFDHIAEGAKSAQQNEGDEGAKVQPEMLAWLFMQGQATDELRKQLEDGR